jgi:DNA-binding transcriptional MocR family regulator
MDAGMQLDWSAAFAGRAEGMHASEIRELLKLLDQPDIISFAGGIPDPALFPTDAVRDACVEILGHNSHGARSLQYSVSEGYLPLRQWLADYMAAQGVPCDADNILITAGSQQALDFLGKLFVGPRDSVLVTAPTYLGALQAFNAYEPTYDIIVPGAAASSAGSYRDRALANGARVALAYAVPDFANPTGITITEPERHDLLALSASLDIPLIEDAAYAALRFDGAPIASCLALDIRQRGSIEQSRVVYCGTFSKTVAPGLRVGWVCAARDLVQKLVLVKQAADLHSATLNQMVMHRVVRTGYDAQLDRIRAFYAERRDAMLAALGRFMPSGVRWTTPQGGMFIWVTLPEGSDGAAMLAAALEQERIAFVPGSAFHVDGSGHNTIRLAYSLQPPTRIDEGMRRLGHLIERTTN